MIARTGPNARLSTALRGARLVVLVLAATALALPGDAGTAAGWAMVVVLITTPLARVAWLGVRWAREHDWRFARLAGGLLAVTAAAAVTAMFTD